MVRLERRDDGTHEILIITLDRPERRNAIDYDTAVGVTDALDQLGDARAVVLTGAPPAFCAGADLAGVDERQFVGVLMKLLAAVTAVPVPVIAAIDGPALGAGVQLAVYCDLRMATERSVFGIPAARLGLVLDAATIDRCATELGTATARAMLVAAERFEAIRLHASGGIHRIGGLDDAIEWAFDLAAMAPLTMAAHKLALAPGDHTEAFDAARVAAWSSHDAEEGRAAFLEKRQPRFTGG